MITYGNVNRFFYKLHRQLDYFLSLINLIKRRRRRKATSSLASYGSRLLKNKSMTSARCRTFFVAVFFLLINSFPLAFVCSTTNPKMMTSLKATASSTVRTVAVIGGTHGNEYTGVFCIKALERKLKNGGDQHYPFRISTLIGNPVAFEQNKRFVDEDLNRQFSAATMAAATAAYTDPAFLSVEQKRAKELDQLLGPKFGNEDQPPATDFIIDLHTTTSNMHTALIVGQGDPLTTQAAAYVMHKCQEKNFKVCIMMHTHKTGEVRPNLSSIAPHAFTIEVGPVPQGVLRHDKVEEMQETLDSALEFLQRNQQEPEKLLNELKTFYPSGKIPCYRSAPAIREGEMSAKLVWPSDPENENFPQWLVHKDVQDQDFQEIKKGDPLFVNLDGNVIPYDGSHGSPVLLMFINEGGYYYASSGTGISVALKDEFDLITGNLIPKELPTLQCSSTTPLK